MVHDVQLLTRVGFILTFDATGWLGGISYFRNLLGAVAALPQPRIAPVIFAGNRTPVEVMEQFPKFPIVRSSLLDQRGLQWFARRGVAKTLGRDVALERILSLHGAQILSHQGFLGGLGRVLPLGWIPDFQEHHFPDFFTPAELRSRANKRALFCSVCPRIILSSNHARHDLETLAPHCVNRARVLPFVADIVAPASSDSVQVVSRLGINGRYFHLPNQFWAHKNHVVVIEALRILKSRGQMVTVVASGNTGDHRQPSYFVQLMAYAHKSGVEDLFLAVGMLPYKDLVALMMGAIAVINPSRFEGWSTTVEEAKSLGKTILLSDIEVHHEQQPQRGFFFSPDDAHGLATLMWDTFRAYDEEVDKEARLKAQAVLPERRLNFARSYEGIVLEALA